MIFGELLIKITIFFGGRFDHWCSAVQVNTTQENKICIIIIDLFLSGQLHDHY